MHGIGSIASKLVCFTPKGRQEAAEEVKREPRGSAASGAPSEPRLPALPALGGHSRDPIPSPGCSFTSLTQICLHIIKINPEILAPLLP